MIETVKPGDGRSPPSRTHWVKLLLAVGVMAGLAADARGNEPFPGTQPLTWDDDLASRMVAGMDRFLLKQLAASVADRSAGWEVDHTSPEKYASSLKPRRERLSRILGLADVRHHDAALQFVATTRQSAEVGRGSGFKIYQVRWPAFADVCGEGLLLEPDQPPVASLILVPDTGQQPEQLAGLVTGTSAPAAQLAAVGCRVVVPFILGRELEQRNGRATMTDREYIYRSAFELGRHVIGYELQKIFAAADYLASASNQPLGIAGWGEGGMYALLTGALDERFDTVLVSGFFGPREDSWQEPLDRNVFGMLQQFGGAELAAMVAPRKLLLEDTPGPQVEFPAGQGGAPARLAPVSIADFEAELARLNKLLNGLATPSPTRLPHDDRPWSATTISYLMSSLTGERAEISDSVSVEATRQLPDRGRRRERQRYEMDRHNQAVLAESPYVRAEFMKKLDTSSLAAYQKSTDWYRDYFGKEIIGEFTQPRLALNPRTRKTHGNERWSRYDVVLDVFPDVFAYGVLLWPAGMQPGEKRPVVVCQHGLEGRPEDTLTGDHRAYHNFASRLADAGFIVFAPQHPYIFGDRFRTLQRKANPLQKTLFSLIVPQHLQITEWLVSLPQVDAERIAFYGLSYGGKSAMRIPPLVDRYCLSICSADFNDWVWKNASSRARYSYVWTGEYEIFEFDLGNTFNYSEMAALIAPRPFMVERGHFDGVAPDERVAYEFAKVRHLYQAILGIGDRCELEWFVGPHTIHGKGTFDFLHKHLDWPKTE